MADLIVNLIRRYRYDTYKRVELEDRRLYVNQETGLSLPSVTSILDKTKNKAKLVDWETKIGTEQAEKIRLEAASVGTAMHNYIEAIIKTRPIASPKNWLQLKGQRMGSSLVEKFFPNIEEIWGSEVSVHYQEKYAGTTDLACMYKGKPSIVDFKQSNKMKKREWLTDYFVQLTAYAQAHNWQHQSEIRQGVVLMASQDGGLQEFMLVGREFDYFLQQWNMRVDEFTAGSSAAPPAAEEAETGSPEGTT